MTRQIRVAPEFSGNGAVDGTVLQTDQHVPSSSGAAGQEVAIGAHDLVAHARRPDERPAETIGDGMRLEQEAGDDAEIAAAAAQRPEQVGILGLAGGHEAAVGKHDVGLEEVVDGQPVFAGQIAVPPPSVSPATPVDETMPNGTARPKACVAWSTSP